MNEPHILIQHGRCPHCGASPSRSGGFLCGTYKTDLGYEEEGLDCLSTRLYRQTEESDQLKAENATLRDRVKQLESTVKMLQGALSKTDIRPRTRPLPDDEAFFAKENEHL